MAHAIAVNDLIMEFPGGRGPPFQALRGLNLAVAEGAVSGFLGPNGAGKTTTIHILLGFLAPTAGRAQIFGEDVRHDIARARIGYLPENPDTYNFLTGRELLTMAGRLFRLPTPVIRRRADELLARVNMAAAADRRIGTYSRGMKQRIGLAQALINDPDLLILDEPTGGLDPLGRMEIRAIIGDLHRRGKTIFFSSHELSEVELICDHVTILAAGQVQAQGAVGDLKPPQESLESYFLRVIGAGGERSAGS